MAERVGFEPTVRLRAHLISSQARSTTPAPLRGGGSYRLPGTGETAPGPGTSLNFRSFSIFGTRAMPLSPEELTDRIHRATPFVATLGARVVEAGDGKAVLRMPVSAPLTQDLGHPHGGVVGALADIACNLALRPASVTIEYKVNFLRGAPAQHLRAEAKLLRAGRTTAVTQAEIWAEQEGVEDKLVAIATATLQPIARES